jgi:hypothetical protein
MLRWRLPRARAVDDTVEMDQVTLPAAYSTGDLKAPVLDVLAELLPLHWRGDKRDTHVVTRERFAPYSGATHPTSLPFPEDEAGAIQVDGPGSKIHAHSS